MFKARLLFFGIGFLGFLTIWTIFGIVLIQPESREIFGTRIQGAGFIMLLFVAGAFYMYARMVIRSFLSAIIINDESIRMQHLGGTQTLKWEDIESIELKEAKPFDFGSLNIIGALTGFKRNQFVGVVIKGKSSSMIISCKDINCEEQSLFETLQNKHGKYSNI